MEAVIHYFDRAIIRAAVDDKFGEGTTAIIQDTITGHSTQEEVAIRLGVTQQAVSQRIRKARTYTRRLLIAAGMVDQKPNEINQTPNIHSDV